MYTQQSPNQVEMSDEQQVKTVTPKRESQRQQQKKRNEQPIKTLTFIRQFLRQQERKGNEGLVQQLIQRIDQLTQDGSAKDEQIEQ